MLKTAKELFLYSAAALVMAGCYSTRASKDDNKAELDSYLWEMRTPSHIKFLKDVRVIPDYSLNALTFKTDAKAKDSTKNVQIDKYGPYASAEATKLVYELDRGWVFQTKLVTMKVDKNVYGYSRITPVLFVDQVDDGQKKSLFDDRYEQVAVTAQKTPGTRQRQLDQKDRFTVNKNGTVTEHMILSAEQNMRYDVTYDFANRRVFGQCPGSKYMQLITTFQNANPATKEIYAYAEALATKQQTLAVGL